RWSPHVVAVCATDGRWQPELAAVPSKRGSGPVTVGEDGLRIGFTVRTGDLRYDLVPVGKLYELLVHAVEAQLASGFDRQDRNRADERDRTTDDPDDGDGPPRADVALANHCANCHASGIESREIVPLAMGRHESH